MVRKAKGEGFFDIAKSLGKVVAPIAIDAGSKALKNYAGGSVRTRRMNGDGFFDIAKSLGKAVAPIAIDAGSKALKNYVGSGLPIGLSRPQYRTLANGGAITIKPGMVQEAGEHLLQLLPQRAKKLMNALGKSKGMRIALQQGEDLIHKATGGSIFDMVKSVGKVLAPIAIDEGSKALKNYVGKGTKKGMVRRTSRQAYEGEGFFDIAKSLGKAVAPIAIDAGAKALKNYAGSGVRSRKKSVRGRGGSPYVSMPYHQAMGNYQQGEGFFDIAKSIGKVLAPVVIDEGSRALKNYVGSGIHGVRGCGGSLDMPIQLGSPYQHIGSPAMNPFRLQRGIQSPDFIPHSVGSGIVPAGTGIVPAGTGIYPAGTMRGRGRGRRSMEGEGAVGSMLGQLAGSFLPF